MTEIYRNDLIYSISYALDYVERELVSVSGHHSKRVAYLSAAMGRAMDYENASLLNLAACGALHDNALSEYQQQKSHGRSAVTPERFLKNLSLHCEIGERNISQLSFYPTVKGAILYHHERADGLGPLGKTTEETPVFSRLIHIADTIDAQFDLSVMDRDKFEAVRAFIRQETGTLYDPETAEVFLQCFATPERMRLDLSSLDERLHAELPEVKASYDPRELIRLASIFSKIIDYKSPFTSRHSAGVAEKARKMGSFYKWDNDIQAQLYLAGALHDVGKLMVKSDLLEKPSRLTVDEYRAIQNHAYGSYIVLHDIRGLEDVASWSYLHHEKLDGSGYPFGRTGEALSKQARIMACVDIYQALRESRPYKDGLSHSAAMDILTEMAHLGQLDAAIVRDIGICFVPESAAVQS